MTVLRREAGLSQEKLAALAGLSVSTVRRLEQNRHSPETATLAAVADALGVPVSRLIETTRPAA